MKHILPLAAIPWFIIGAICAALASMPVLCIGLAMAAIFFAFVVAIQAQDDRDLDAARMDNQIGAKALRSMSAKMVRAKRAGIAIWESCSKILPEHTAKELKRRHASDFAALEILSESANESLFDHDHVNR